MRKAVAEKLADQLADWGHRGLVDAELSARLKRRYATDITFGRVFLRWLGFLAVFMLGMSVLGFLGMSLGPLARYLSPFVLGALAWGLWSKGTAMAADVEQRYPMSGAVLVTVALIMGFGALLGLYGVAGGSNVRFAAPIVMLLTASAAAFTAYRFGLRWPLTLSVLLLFHALGNMHRYGGHGSYFLGIQDERITLLVAISAVVFGMWHEKARENDLDCKEVGFGQIYIVFGLLYANLALWILSLPQGALPQVLLFTAAGVAQIVLGGRFHDGRFTGFGLVFLFINIYTRMFEQFWNAMSKGSFFLLAGAAAMALGIAFEMRARQLRQRPEA